ncbi:VacJ family lipoprotein [Geminicoccaceae bacterium 1502E]|nr:VacJ family lipoprotein [Geminicoccaceae bacterium 1502E]
MRFPATTALAALTLSACAGTTPLEAPSAPLYPIAVYDPFEPVNRSIYRFNASFDRYIFLPVVRGYEWLLPDPVERRVSSFFSNLGEIRNAANGLLQARPEVASRATIRFAVNSTLGLLGLFDVAGAMGVEQQREDFGQTLGRWGVSGGPYIVLPILGPSNLRDTTGTVVDRGVMTQLPPWDVVIDEVYVNPAVYGLEAVDERHLNPFRYYGTGSPFEYEYVRYLYTKKRQFDVKR